MHALLIYSMINYTFVDKMLAYLSEIKYIKAMNILKSHSSEFRSLIGVVKIS